MRIQVVVELSGLRFETILDGETDEELFRKFRHEAQSRLPFVHRQVARCLDDASFMKRVVDLHNRGTGSSEAHPTDAGSFLAFGRRAGYVRSV